MQTAAFSDYSSSVLSLMTEGLDIGDDRYIPESAHRCIRVTRVSDDEFALDRLNGDRVGQELLVRRDVSDFEPLEFCGQRSSEPRLTEWSSEFINELSITCNLATIH
jgi:hypothetical protein